MPLVIYGLGDAHTHTHVSIHLQTNVISRNQVHTGLIASACIMKIKLEFRQTSYYLAPDHVHTLNLIGNNNSK